METIQTDKFYRPQEIVKNGWIKNLQGKSTYDYVLKLCRLGAIKAKNRGLGKVPHYVIRGNAIIEYLEKIN